MKSLFFVLAIVCLLACSKPTSAPSVITGKSFPEVRGKSLAEKEVLLPKDYNGKYSVFLIGYLQEAQFDIDRWILGILQAELPLQIVEVPTIAGMMPRVVQRFIDAGMRKGIPQEDWASVVTVYEDASKIIAAFGNERPRNAYAVVLDSVGQIVWTSNRGYSAGQILELKKLLADL